MFRNISYALVSLFLACVKASYKLILNHRGSSPNTKFCTTDSGADSFNFQSSVDWNGNIFVGLHDDVLSYVGSRSVVLILRERLLIYPPNLCYEQMKNEQQDDKIFVSEVELQEFLFSESPAFDSQPLNELDVIEFKHKYSHKPNRTESQVSISDEVPRSIPIPPMDTSGEYHGLHDGDLVIVLTSANHRMRSYQSPNLEEFLGLIHSKLPSDPLCGGEVARICEDFGVYFRHVHVSVLSIDAVEVKSDQILDPISIQEIGGIKTLNLASVLKVMPSYTSDWPVEIQYSRDRLAILFDKEPWLVATLVKAEDGDAKSIIIEQTRGALGMVLRNNEVLQASEYSDITKPIYRDLSVLPRKIVGDYNLEENDIILLVLPIKDFSSEEKMSQQSKGPLIPMNLAALFDSVEGDPSALSEIIANVAKFHEQDYILVVALLKYE